MSEDLFEAIYSQFTAAPANAFYTATGGRMEYSRAPESWTDNFAVVQGIGIDQDDLMSQAMDDALFQISVFSTTRAGCFDLLEKCRDLFDGIMITPTGYTATRISRENQTPPAWNEADNLYQATITFSCWLY